MDASTAGLYGGIAGGVVGLFGAAVGTAMSYRRAPDSAGRRFVIRAAVVGSAGIVAFVTAMLALPRPWNLAAYAAYVPLLVLWMRWAGRGELRTVENARVRGARRPE